MAVATSDASARVGVGVTIIDSSICVATMYGLPALRQARRIRRWTTGTDSGRISTPRSPRAAMMPSEISTISVRRSITDGFSSFANIGAPADEVAHLLNVLRTLHGG